MFLGGLLKMLDKIDFSCITNIELIYFIKEYCYFRNLKTHYGSGSKFFHQKSILNEEFQVFYTHIDDELVSAYVSIGSYFSNRFGFHLLKRLSKNNVDKIKIRRLDFAYDLHGIKAEEFKIAKFNVSLKPATAKPKCKIYYNGIKQNLIDTAYLSTSNFTIRMYDKGVEQKESEYNSNWKRFEVQINAKMLDLYIGNQYLIFNGRTTKDLLEDYNILLNKISEQYKFNQKYMRMLSSLKTNPSRRFKRINRKSDMSKMFEWLEKNFDKHIKYYVVHKLDEFEELLYDEKAQKDAICDFLQYWSKRG